jgi:hypothetical protein
VKHISTKLRGAELARAERLGQRLIVPIVRCGCGTHQIVCLSSSACRFSWRAWVGLPADKAVSFLQCCQLAVVHVCVQRDRSAVSAGCRAAAFFMLPQQGRDGVCGRVFWWVLVGLWDVSAGYVGLVGYCAPVLGEGPVSARSCVASQALWLVPQLAWLQPLVLLPVQLRDGVGIATCTKVHVGR